MIRLLVPLGLLGLLGVVALIIIYIIRPNYQVKHISSTYVWNLSLKYKRKRIPISQLRHLLILLCQLFILTLAAGILSMPAIVHEKETDDSDIIVILDSSASMYAGNNGDTRFMRAAELIYDQTDRVLKEGGYVTFILADSTPTILQQRVSLNNSKGLMDTLDEFMMGDMAETTNRCSYGVADMDAAMLLCEEVLNINSNATIYIYTDTKYDYVPGNIEIVPVAQPDEWNVAVLDASAELHDGFYMVSVDVASYGRDLDVELSLDVSGANAMDASDKGDSITLNQHVFCEADKTKTVIFRFVKKADGDQKQEEESENIIYRNLGVNERFFSYQSIHITIAEKDSFVVDNSFDIYGGLKEVLKIQYASTKPNIFFTGALLSLKNAMRDSGKWDLQITDVKQGEEPATQGFDFYIFEHMIPQVEPKDGVIFFVDPPRSSPGLAGFTVNRTVDLVGKSVYLTPEDAEHPIMQNVLAGSVTVSKYLMLSFDEDTYQTLISCSGNPILAVQKKDNIQAAVMAFSVHYSNIVEMPEFYLILKNMFNYFMPATVDKNAFEVGESISFNSRGTKLSIEGGGEPKPVEYESFPGSTILSVPGTYKLTGNTYFDKTKEIITNIFVKIPMTESNINPTADTLPDPYSLIEISTWYDDLLVYLAAAVVALLFIEWILHALENK